MVAKEVALVAVEVGEAQVSGAGAVALGASMEGIAKLRGEGKVGKPGIDKGGGKEDA